MDDKRATRAGFSLRESGRQFESAHHDKKKPYRFRGKAFFLFFRNFNSREIIMAL
jgi:hypothetical protein